MGADAFAERARHELLATGEKVRRRLDETRDELTPQEEHIARLARDGRTNPEIGAQLFLSPRTVEWHLRQGVRQARDQLAPRPPRRPAETGTPQPCEEHLPSDHVRGHSRAFDLVVEGEEALAGQVEAVVRLQLAFDDVDEDAFLEIEQLENGQRVSSLSTELR